MHFTRLRLNGFKSFVDPVDLAIEPGMTGIVGPNGCGKSNLIEALRWVMGETSARRMRGGDMDDVIFGGTAQRPARNVAEVVLTARHNGVPPSGVAAAPGSNEFEISRRIERGEGSDYRLSGRPVRARDVQTLFADLASGAHSPALVSQGRVAALIAAKPTERRQVLEDAAGISGLHARRHEAELKLRAAETNLNRLEDVLGAMQTQLASLKKQARQAVRYREITEEIRRVDAMLLALRWRAAALREAEARAAFDAAENAVRQAMLDVGHATTRNTEQAAILPPLRREEAQRGEALAAVMARRDTLVMEERQLEAAVAEVQKQADQLAADRAHEERQRIEAEMLDVRLGAESEELTAEAARDPALRGEAQTSVDAARARVAAGDTALTQLTETVATTEAQSNALQRQKRDLEQRLAALDKRISDERQRLDAMPQTDADAEAIEAAAAKLAEAERAASVARDALTAAEKARFDADTAIAAARNAERQATGEATRLAAEQRAIANLLRSADTAGFAPVLDALHVERGYETALAVALSDGLEGSLDAAAPAHWRAASVKGSAGALPAGAEPLAPKIQAPPALAAALSSVGIVDDTATGDRLAGDLGPGQSLVTKSGALWRWDGFTRRPGAESHAAIRLEQRNRLEQIERELTGANEAAEKAASSLAEADKTLAAVSAAEKQARGEVMSATATVERARGEHMQRRRDAESRSLARQALMDSLALAESDRAGTASAIEAADAAVGALPDLAETRRNLEEARAHLVTERNTLISAQSEFDRIEREAATRAQRIAAIVREREEWKDRAARAVARLAELEERAAALDVTRQKLADEPARLAAARQAILTELEAAEKARAEAADRVAEAEAAQQASERALRQVEAVQGEARENRVRAEAAVAAGLEEFQQLKLWAVERLGDAAPAEMNLETLSAMAEVTPEALPDLEIAEARHAKLIRDRDNIGPVNLRAELEMTELDAELGRMTAERDDLVAAIGRLRQAVISLNKEARERLLSSFSTIDKHFRSLFERLFGGGSAELRLTEAEDPLEAGLEILASPPGKKLQNLSLLSGGEQALTAIALIFAMFLTNPSPICVLDEVDAPLDDANVDRFCLLVQEIANTVGTRFLIITHHRLTMARMDRLYGVTMAEQGVSQLVSVDLRGADELRAAE